MRRRADGNGASQGSAIARSFGARVAFDLPGRALFLVVGRMGSPAGIVTGVGGTVALQLPGSTKLLAFLPAGAVGTVQRHREIALAGAVSIDPERFARFAALTGLDQQRDAGLGEASPQPHG